MKSSCELSVSTFRHSSLSASTSLSLVSSSLPPPPPSSLPPPFLSSSLASLSHPLCLPLSVPSFLSYSLPSSDKYNFSFFLKRKNLQGFNYSQEAERGDSLGEAAPPAEHGCLLQPGSLLSPRSPPGGAAETRRAAAGPPRTPGKRVLTGQGDDAAEVLVAAHTTSSSWGQKRK